MRTLTGESDFGDAGPDEVHLVVANKRISGWTSVRITRGCERLPNDFDISMTERFPGDLNGAVVIPGDPLQLFIGNDLTITGYVDRYYSTLTADQHAIRVTGRGKTQDLVDCSAEWPGCQINGATALGIAQRLAKPYGISVSEVGKPEIGGVIPSFSISVTDSAGEIIERILSP